MFLSEMLVQLIVLGIRNTEECFHSLVWELECWELSNVFQPEPRSIWPVLSINRFQQPFLIKYYRNQNYFEHVYISIVVIWNS